MNRKINLLYVIFRDVIMLITFILAVNLEKAGLDRLLLMVVLFLSLLTWVHTREFLCKRFGGILPYSFIVDIIILLFLDYSSKYVVNYYFNVYYFYVLISAGFIIKHRDRLIVSFALIAAALVKYLRLAEMYNTSFVLSYMFFMLMVFINVAVFFNYSKFLSQERLKLDNLNSELIRVNKELEYKNERIRELAIYQERNRIARDIHDSVGHNLTGLIMNLEFCEKSINDGDCDLKSQLTKARGIAKESLAEIRKSVQALRPKELEYPSIIRSIEELIRNSQERLNTAIKLNVSGEVYNMVPEFNVALYRAVQEAVTNSARHGRAEKVEVDIEFGDTALSVLIKDNGRGAKGFRPNSGLKGMIERIEEFGGEVSFDTNDGFMIYIKVPKFQVI